MKTLKKAIEILDRYFILNHNVPRAELNEAAKLGIEALKRIRGQTYPYFQKHYKPLPGETEE